MTAQQTIPTLGASDLAAIKANIASGSEGIGAINTNPTSAGQGVGTNYLGLLPTYMQNATNGLLANVQPGQDPVLDWFVNNGYLQQTMSGGGDNAYQTFVPGPNAPKELGTQGYGNTDQTMQLTNANPFGSTVQGALDMHNVLSPQQAPQLFGSNQYGPTEATRNLQQNQDVWSRIVPLMELGAGLGFGALGGFGDLGSLGKGIFNTLGGMVTSGNVNPISLASIGANAIPGFSAISPYLNAGVGIFNASRTGNPFALLSTLGAMARTGGNG